MLTVLNIIFYFVSTLSCLHKALSGQKKSVILKYYDEKNDFILLISEDLMGFSQRTRLEHLH